MAGLDTLNLSSVYGRVRNPQGNRRWGFWDQVPAKATVYPARVTQELLVAGQNFAVNNLAPTQFFPDQVSQLVQRLNGQDFWTRPAARWFRVNVTAAGTAVQITSVTGTPFVLVDPIVTSHAISAQVGEDIVLDYGTQKYELKITAVTPNSVLAVPKTGGTLPPPMAAVSAYHRIDGYFLELTTTFVAPNTEINPTPAAPTQVRTGIRLVYYTTGAPINQDYQSIPIRSLAGAPFLATTPVTGSRFGQQAATQYTQVAELYNIAVARVPDEVHLLLNEVWLQPGRVSNPALYIGDYINVSVPINMNLLNPGAANVVDQQQYPPVDPEDFLSASGDIVMVSAGQQCPPGYENVAQIESRFNDNYVKAEGGLPNAGQAAAIAFTITVTSGATIFAGALPHTTPASHSLAGPQNDSSTYELLVVRNGKRFAYRIPSVSFAANGNISFSVPADLRFLIDTAPNFVTGYLFQGGLLIRDALGSPNVGQYRKPFIEDENIELAQWSFTGDGPIATQGLTLIGQDGFAFIDRLLVENAQLFRVGDLVSFRDSTGALLSVPAAAAFFSAPGSRNIAAVHAFYPFGPVFRVSSVNVDEGFIVVQDLAGNPTDVSGYVIGFNTGAGSPFDTNPPTFQDNFYQIETGSVEHRHLIEPSDDQKVKDYNDGGHWVTKESHYHTVTPEAVIPPYVKALVCVRL